MELLKILVKFIGTGCMILGIILTTLGVSGLAWEGRYAPTFYISGRRVTPQEGGQITLIAGLTFLLAGIVITYLRRLLKLT